MPPKIRDLDKKLKKAGFNLTNAKGSHRKYQYLPLGIKVILSGSLGADALPYQEKQIADAIEKKTK